MHPTLQAKIVPTRKQIHLPFLFHVQAHLQASQLRTIKERPGTVPIRAWLLPEAQAIHTEEDIEVVFQILLIRAPTVHPPPLARIVYEPTLSQIF